MPGILLRFVLHALHAHLKVRRVLVAGEDGHLALSVHQRRQLGHRRRAGLVVVHAIEREPLRLRRVAVEHHHRHAAIDGVVDRAGHLSRVGRREENRARAVVHGLANALRLHLAVFLRRREPHDLDIDSLLLRELLRGGLGAGTRGEEHRIRRALGDHGDGDLVACRLRPPPLAWKYPSRPSRRRRRPTIASAATLHASLFVIRVSTVSRCGYLCR